MDFWNEVLDERTLWLRLSERPREVEGMKQLFSAPGVYRVARVLVTHTEEETAEATAFQHTLEHDWKPLLQRRFDFRVELVAASQIPSQLPAPLVWLSSEYGPTRPPNRVTGTRFYISDYASSAHPSVPLLVRRVVDAAGFDQLDPPHSQLAYHRVFVDDTPHAAPKLLRHVDAVLQFVRSTDADEPVLIHCASGISRSATLLLFVLMDEGIQLKEAFQLLKRCRPKIRPNAGFSRLLVEREALLFPQPSVVLREGDERNMRFTLLDLVSE